MRKRLLALLLAGVLLVGSAGAAFSATKTYTPGQFTDVAANAWYAASVKKVFELNLMNGSSTTTFNPGGMFTVAETLTVAARMHSLSHGGNGVLPAASGAWYQNAVDYCTKNKLITDGQFDSYTRSATRAEMAGVIRAALPDDQWKAINSVSALPDVNMGNEYAQAIFDLYNAGVFTGSDDYGMFQPYAYITRAEVAAIVARCADPSQRKTLSLKPLSQRQAPELLGGYRSDRKMSNGRLAYQDPTSKKWGYLDGNGNAVIPAQYDSAEDFEGGYAVVNKNGGIFGLYGLINTAGAAVVPVEQDWLTNTYARKENKYAFVSNGKLVSGYIYDSINSLPDIRGYDVTGLYTVKQNDKVGVANSAGKVIIPIQYDYRSWSSNIQSNGVYISGRLSEGGADIYDLNGAKLGHFAEGFYWALGNPLLAVKEGNKYAVAVGGKKITEAVYDSVELAEYQPFAMVKYGSQVGLVGEAGELIAPGTYSKFVFNGGYFAGFTGTGIDHPDTVVVGDATGVLHTGTYHDGYRSSYQFEPYLEVYEDTGAFFCRIYNMTEDTGVLFQKNGTIRNVTCKGPCLTWIDEDEMYLLTNAGKVFGPRTYYSTYHYYYDQQTWEDEDGTHTEYSYGIWDETGELSKPIYDSDDEAEAAYKEYSTKQRSNTYAIRQSDAGKPIVAYGNDTTGWTPVIEFYKNNMYYDEIKDIGEGYYACRFNTTWYLLHA